MLAARGIVNERDRDRIERQSALMLAAISIHKQELGLPPSTPPIEPGDVGLLTEAREALDTARKENGHDVWGVMHHPRDHTTVRRFLRI